MASRVGGVLRLDQGKERAGWRVVHAGVRHAGSVCGLEGTWAPQWRASGIDCGGHLGASCISWRASRHLTVGGRQNGRMRCTSCSTCGGGTYIGSSCYTRRASSSGCEATRAARGGRQARGAVNACRRSSGHIGSGKHNGSASHGSNCGGCEQRRARHRQSGGHSMRHGKSGGHSMC